LRKRAALFSGRKRERASRSAERKRQKGEAVSDIGSVSGQKSLAMSTQESALSTFRWIRCGGSIRVPAAAIDGNLDSRLAVVGGNPRFERQRAGIAASGVASLSARRARSPLRKARKN